MRTTIIISSLILLYFQADAQKPDSVKKEFKEFIIDKFPATRPIDVQFEQFGSRSFDSKFPGADSRRGKIDNESRLKVALNIPVYKAKNYTITTSIKYKYNYYSFTDINSTGQYSPAKPPSNVSVHYLFAAGSFTYFSKLFGKPAIFNATLSVDGNEDGVQRVKGLVAAAIILKRTQFTLITVGLVGLIDRTALSPVLPSFSWKQSFSNSPWSLDFILPQRAMVQRNLFKNGRLSIGSEFIGEGFYVKPGNSFSPGTYQYTQLEIRSGVMYEHSLGSRTILSFKGGLANTLMARLNKKNAAFSDYVYKNSQNGVGYFNVGISFNPFKAGSGGRK